MSTIQNKDLKRRILDLSYKHCLSHIGSCMTAVDIIDEIYSLKQPDEPFILSSGHAGLALYVVIEKYEKKDAEEIFLHHGIHPDRCADCHIGCSTGSLGQGLPIAVGMALADRSKNVYCLISDGECAEGSIWEALRIIEDCEISNIHVYINNNGYSAYDAKDPILLNYRIEEYCNLNEQTHTKMTKQELPFLVGVNAHYHVMSKADYSIGTALLV